jgi:hypothetical protein
LERNLDQTRLIEVTQFFGAIVAMVACNTDESSTTDVVPAPYLSVERELLRGLSERATRA